MDVWLVDWRSKKEVILISETQPEPGITRVSYDKYVDMYNGL